ncbi:MAG: radical SAM protein [Desulfobacterales bacterium]
MPKKQSPEYARMSLAAAMTLGFKSGMFYRNAKLYCINLLLTYEDGCIAKCAYCGLSKSRSGEYVDKSFIRVDWPNYPLDEIISRIEARKNQVKRICISMVTRKRAVAHTTDICKQLSRTKIPISILVSPTVLSESDVKAFRAAGADKIGVAVDLATKDLFDRYRGSGVGGPHRWERYWDCLAQAVSLVGDGNAGPHFIVGMGETEQEMCRAIQRSRDMGGRTHLFSFYPEADSAMADHRPPSMDQYRRIQLARFIIDEAASRVDGFAFDPEGRICDFGINGNRLNRMIESGEPFRTSGCSGKDGSVACNRPYANSRPGPNIRNFPFAPGETDIRNIKHQIQWLTTQACAENR